MKKIQFTIFFWFILTLNNVVRPETTYEIKGTITGVTGKKRVHVSLYNEDSKWLSTKKEEAYKKVILESYRVANGQVKYSFNNIPGGDYAIAVFEDLNGDGKLNKGLFGPKEPYGFFKNYSPTFNAPNFRDCSFTLLGKMTKANIPLLNRE